MHVQTYTFDQLAVLFQRSAATLRGHIDTLEREHNFPARLPCLDNLWSKPAVDRWFDNNAFQAKTRLTWGRDGWHGSRVNELEIAAVEQDFAAKYGDA